jgi:hypothetical protein
MYDLTNVNSDASSEEGVQVPKCVPSLEGSLINLNQVIVEGDFVENTEV